MASQPAVLHEPQDRHRNALKEQIARCLDEEMKFMADERRERARQFGTVFENCARIGKPSQTIS
jgi:hypothetical protein